MRDPCSSTEKRSGTGEVARRVSAVTKGAQGHWLASSWSG